MQPKYAHDYYSLLQGTGVGEQTIFFNEPAGRLEQRLFTRCVDGLYGFI